MLHLLLAILIFLKTSVLSYRDFCRGKFGLFSPGKAICDRMTLPTPSACWVFLCFHNWTDSDMDYRIFNVRTDVNIWSCTQGCTDTVRESALKVDSGRKIPCRTGESNLCQRLAGPTLCQESCLRGSFNIIFYQPSSDIKWHVLRTVS